MAALDVLKDPAAAPSVALEATQRLLGSTMRAWEPESIRIALARRSVPSLDVLMGKLMAAIAVQMTRTWVYDHDVLFAFAVACAGVPADSEALHHPTPEQLCWAMNEIHALTGHTLDADEGLDPDTVDPAIAAVLHDEGYVLAPDELQFAQDALAIANQHADIKELHKTTKAAWKAISALPTSELHQRLSELDEGPEEIQVKRLGHCRLYVVEHELLRARQHAALNE